MQETGFGVATTFVQIATLRAVFPACAGMQGWALCVCVQTGFTQHGFHLVAVACKGCRDWEC